MCPVYDVTRHERLAPRGKYRLLTDILGKDPDSSLKGQGPGKDTIQVKVLETLKACLQCGACTTVCPTGVEVDALIRKARARYPESFSIPSWLWEVFLSRRPASMLTKILAVVPGTSGLVLRLFGLANRSRDENASHFVIPPFAPRPFLSRKNLRRFGQASWSNAGPGPKIALFVGCVQNYIYPEVVKAVIQWFGGRVLVPQGQGCCGLPAWSAGALKPAQRLARRNIRAFETARADFIVTGCAACASMIKKWPELFSEDDPEREKAIKLAAKVREFSQLAMELEVIPHRVQRDSSITVTYHAPCHQRFDPGGVETSENLLGMMFPKTFTPMSHKCCGQGGLFSLGHPELAWKIFEKRLSAWDRTGSSVVVTTCSGCLLQWRAGTTNQAGMPKVLHLAELIYYLQSP